MKLKGFKEISSKKQEEIYGGWAWLVAAIPLAVQGIMALASSYKALTSDNGSIKNNGTDVKWENHKEPISKAAKVTKVQSKEAKRIFYVF